MSTPTLRSLTLLWAVLLILAGCDAAGSMDDAADEDLTVTAEETAASVATALAQETGGTADDIEDVARFAHDLTAGPKAFSRDCTFDAAAIWWTCSVAFDRSGNLRSRTYERTYRVQFFDADGTPQSNYRVGGVPADSLTFTVLEGSGRFSSPRVESSHTILGTPTWHVAINDSVLVMNGSGGRAHTDSLTTNRTTRVRDASQESTLTDIAWVRGDGIDSGTISGTHEAEVVITRLNGETATRSISVTFEATFTDGTGTITLTGGGERFNGKAFAFDLMTGDLDE